jgi:hypothetical protein
MRATTAPRGQEVDSCRGRYTPERIVRKLHEADRIIAEGKTMAVVLKQLDISEQTYCCWRKAYGELSADQARHLKEVEAENRPPDEARRGQGARTRRDAGDRPGNL